MAELTDLSLVEMSASLRRGDYTSRELTQAFMEQITRHEAALHTFITLTPEQALQMAAEADHRLETWRTDPSTPLSPLIGIPIAVKDILCVAGVRCTCGSKILENFVPPYDATCVARLRKAGM